MPELPEVEVVKREINKSLENRIIKRFDIRFPKLREEVSKELYSLENLKVLKVDRRAKYIIIETDKGCILIHLGMSGVISIVSSEIPVKKHDHVDILLDDNVIIRLNDPRRFGLFKWFKDLIELNNYKGIKKLGVEPLSDDFTAEYLKEKLFKKSTVDIKTSLLNQEVVVGIGNIYASEILYEVGISPLRNSCDVSLDECEQIVQVTRTILQKSIQMGGTTIKDFSDAHGHIGAYVNSLKIYGHQGEKCKKCGSIIEKIVIKGRSTYYCPHCQK